MQNAYYFEKCNICEPSFIAGSYWKQLDSIGIYMINHVGHMLGQLTERQTTLQQVDVDQHAR